MQGNREVARRAFFVGAVFEGGLVVTAFALAALTGTRLLPLLRGGWTDVATALAVTALLAPIPFVTARSRSGPIAEIRRIIDENLLPLFGRCTWDELLALAALAGLGEEMLFRGWLQTWLAGPLGPLGALAAASVAFGLVHAVTRWYAVLAAVIGALLGALFLWTENLIAPILVHALYDFIALMVLMRRAPPADPEPSHAGPSDTAEPS